MTPSALGTVTSVDPTTGATIAEYPLHGAAQIEAALEAARASHLALRELDFQARGEMLLSIARELRASRQELAELIGLEMGKVHAEGLAEIDKSAWACEYYAEHGAEHLADEAVPTEWAQTYVEFVPLGVLLAVMPWNYPVWQLIRAAAPAWMAGNSCVLKHASNVSGCALALGEIVSRAAGDLDPLQVVLLPGSRVEELIADPRVAAVTLTGSEAAGIQVAGACARYLKKSVLELGGSDPFIVLADADVDAAAEAAVTARFLNAGQSCIAGKRFIVSAPVAASFTDAFAARAAALRLDAPDVEGADLGPMARRDLRDELADQVSRSLEGGGRVVTGGKHPDGPGAFFAPTVVAGVEPDAVLATEETFGPAAAVITAEDDDAAIAIANASRYGLSSSLWTTDVERARALAPRIEAGAVFVNAPSASDPRMPFGGVKASGWGRELGSFGIREFVNVQAVTVGPRGGS